MKLNEIFFRTMNVQKEIFKNVPRVSSNNTNQVRIHQSVDHVVYLTSHF